MRTGIRLNDLLAHERFVRTVAARLVGPDDVDDLVQRTWLATALRGPSKPGRLRAWLAVVTRNLAGKLRRETTRRVRREQAATPRPAPPTPLELSEREALRRAVADAVLELEPALRDAVLLRWFEGLTSREAAARLDVPVETFRTRLKRAHARLREKLDAQYGDRGPWAATAMALGGADLARGASAGSAAGGVLMTAKIKALAAGAIVVLAAAGALWSVRAAAGDEGRPSAAAVEIPNGAGAPGPASLKAQAPGPVAIVPSPYRTAGAETAAESGPAEGSLRVRAHWSDGTAAAGVGVTFQLRGAGRAGSREAVTDSTGLTPPIAAPPPSATARLDRGLRHWPVDIVAGRERILDCEMEAGTSVSGVVVDGEECPLPGAEILVSGDGRAPCIIARTASDGTYSARDVHAALSVFARADGRAPCTPQRVGGGANRPVRRDFKLPDEGAVVVGTVTSADGAELGGVRVMVAPLGFGGAPGAPAGLDGAVRATTGEDGRFRAGPLPGGPCVAIACAPGYAVAEAPATAEVGQAAVVRLRMRRASRLVGTAQGRLTEHLVVTVEGDGEFDRASATIENEGAYMVHGITPGRRRVRLNDKGELRATAQIDFPEGGEVRWDPLLAEDQRIRGRVVVANDRPLPGVVARLYRRLGDRRIQTDQRIVDSDGRFSLGTTSGETFLVDICEPNSGRVLVPPREIVPGLAEHVFVVDSDRIPSARIEGVLVAADGKPATDGYVHLSEATVGHSIVMRPHPATGGFKSDGLLPPGRYRLVFESGDARIPMPLGTRELAAGETWDLGVVRLPVPGRAVVHVRSADGTLEASPKVAVFTADGTPLAPSAATSGASEFAFDAAPGRYWIAAMGDASVSPAWREAEITGAGEVTVDLRRARGVDVVVSPPPGTRVVVALVGPRVPLCVADLDKNGAAAFRLPAGTFDLEARRGDDVAPVRRQVVVPEDGKPLSISIKVD